MKIMFSYRVQEFNNETLFTSKKGKEKYVTHFVFSRSEFSLLLIAEKKCFLLVSMEKHLRNNLKLVLMT